MREKKESASFFFQVNFAFYSTDFQAWALALSKQKSGLFVRHSSTAGNQSGDALAF